MSIVKSFSVGDGDMFYIQHNSDNFSIIDCCMCEENKENIVEELKEQSNGKEIVRFISTHPDDDHIGGLVYLDDQMKLLNFYCVANNAQKKDECWTKDFERYCYLRDGDKAFHVDRDCKRKWMNESSEERGRAGINFLWPVTYDRNYQDALQEAADTESPNNISPIFTYSIQEGPTFIWMGDLESNFQENIQNEIILPSVDILFAPHHGRVSGKVCEKWLDQMSPGIVVIGEAPSEYLHYYDSYNTITQNSADDIIFDCLGNKIHIYVSNKWYYVDFLRNENMPNAHNAYYLGTYETKEK